MDAELLENNVIPIFSRIEQNFNVDSTYTQDWMYISKKLNNSFGRSAFKQLIKNEISCDANNNNNTNITACKDHNEQNRDSTVKSNEKRRLMVSTGNATGKTVLESYV